MKIAKPLIIIKRKRGTFTILTLTNDQREFILSLELAMANLLLDGHNKFAFVLSRIIHWLHKGDPVTAYLEAESMQVDHRLLLTIKTVFDVRY